MTARVEIHTPKGLCEITAAGKLRTSAGVLSAYMVKSGVITVRYNPKKVSEAELINLINPKAKPCKQPRPLQKQKQAKPLAA